MRASAHLLGKRFLWFFLVLSYVVSCSPAGYAPPSSDILNVVQPPPGGSSGFPKLGTPEGWFPDPAPRASWKIGLNIDRISQEFEMGNTLGELNRALRRILKKAGYLDVGALRTQGGFVLMTRIEQINNLGEPLSGNARWATEIRNDNSFSFANIIRALFSVPVGHYRVLAIVVTDSNSLKISNDTPKTSQQIEELLANGRPDIPADVGAVQVSPHHNITLLIYEFRKQNDGELLWVRGSVNFQSQLAAIGLINYVN